MAPAAARFYGDPSREIEVVGITGTNGKTTTAFVLRAILEAAGRPTGMIGTVKTVAAGVERGGERTTPEAVDVQRDLRAMVDGGDSACVMEVSSVGLAMHRADGVRFRFAALTNFTVDHLDFHGSMEAYWTAKRALFEAAPPEGAVLNADDDRGRELHEELPGSITYGVAGDADVRADEVELERGASGGARFTAVAGERRLELHSPLAARFNVDNVLGAVAIALRMGVEDEPIVRGVAAAPPVPGRLEAVDEGQRFAVIVDYAHSPDSVRRSLEELQPITSGRLLCVFGATGARFADTRPEMGAAARALCDVLVVSSDHPDKHDPGAIDDILRGAGGDAVVVADRAGAIERAVELAKPGDTVAVLGGELPDRDVAMARATLRRARRPA
jgi:UDP-N-acetylmuramoyl-L-alanyl-D-glutamate--2,6-diaminopimelate ligase